LPPNATQPRFAGPLGYVREPADSGEAESAGSHRAMIDAYAELDPDVRVFI
jgi:hypothetical protein